MRGLWKPGVTLSARPVLAILTLDGSVYYDTDATCHAIAVADLGLDFALVRDGGFIVGGEFCYGSYDAARLADEARARLPS